MTKAELIDRIARSRDLPPDVTKKCIAEILDVAFDELSTYFVRTKITRNQTPRFTMPGFGTFTKKRRAPRRGVNPQTLKPMEIPGYDTLDFKPGTELKAALVQARASKGRGTKAKSATKRVAGTRAKAKPAGKARTAKSKPATRRGTEATPASRRATGIAGRRLRKREDLEYLEFEDVSLPEAPMQRSRGKRKRKKDSESTG